MRVCTHAHAHLEIYIYMPWPLTASPFCTDSTSGGSAGTKWWTAHADVRLLPPCRGCIAHMHTLIFRGFYRSAAVSPRSGTAMATWLRWPRLQGLTDKGSWRIHSREGLQYTVYTATPWWKEHSQCMHDGRGRCATYVLYSVQQAPLEGHTGRSNWKATAADSTVKLHCP